MLSDAEGYAARADECRRLADGTDDVPLKTQLINLSESFLEYARHLETRERADPVRDCDQRGMQ
jgi:hypothetical protein